MNGVGKTKFRDIAKTYWQKYQNELSKHMVETAKVFENINTNADIDQATKQSADNVTNAFNSSCNVAYSSNR